MNPESAHVSSTEAIERFRARLIVHRDKVKPLLADASDEVSRTREWLLDRRRFWEFETRRRKQQLDDARQAYFSARFSNLREVKTSELQAVQRAQRSLDESEAKLATIKRWTTSFEQQAGPLLKQVEQLRTINSTTLTRADEYLRRVSSALDQYTLPAAQVENTLPASGEAAPAS